MVRPGVLRAVNIHPRLPFWIGDESNPLPPGTHFESAEPFTILLPEQRKVQFQCASPEHEGGGVGFSDSHASSNFRTLAVTVEPTGIGPPVRLRELLEESVVEDRGRAVVDLVRSALSVVRQSAGSDEFFDAAVQAAAEMIELDRALVVLWEANRWEIRAAYERDTSTLNGEVKRTYSESLINRVQNTGQTAIFEPRNYLHTAGSSLMLLDRAVASPIFDKEGKVIGVLYGDRKMMGSASTPIGDLEAALFEVLAGAVSSGIARQHQEAIRASLSQFFSPAVAERLENDQSLLLGLDAEVSVLFCDIRGFSAVAERVGPARTIAWINDVLTDLSQCVMRHDGVLVDYIGDELMAMFGMPGNQPDHAIRACKAACEMIEQVQPLRERWKEITPDGFGVGIGINSGMARVGNTGSRIKFKYGPLGNTVNMASRVQGVSKQVGVTALITAETAKAIGNKFPTRRLARVQMVGIQEPVDIFQLEPSNTPSWLQLQSKYEAALKAFESNDLTNSARQLAAILHEFPEDRPSLILLGRAVDRLTHRTQETESVWVLDRKK